MSDGRWAEIKALFEAAVELPPEQRAAFLAEKAHGDADLRAEVESLLRADAAEDALARRLPLGLDANAAVLGALAHDESNRYDEQPLPSGSRVGPYTIVAPIGAGGMGEVFRARDPRLGRDVAIKVLPRALERDGTHLARFRREAQVLASLNHPHIATLYGLEEANGRPALVLELIEGPTLQDRVAKGALPQREALGIACQIAGALDAAHEKGVVHRDLKPSNVALTAAGDVKLLDFGVSTVRRALEEGQSLTVMASATVPGAVIGTVSYMSPEQARGQPVDKRCDVWAFGCVLFEMLTGAKAFAGETVADTMLAVLERPPKLDALPQSTPLHVRRLLARCLEKDARKRLHDIADARTALEELLSAPSQRIERQPAIAVLPFANMSADPDNEYFGDGLAEEVLNALARIPGLKVIARTSSFAFRGKQQDVRQIAETLDVTSVLEGSVRKAGNRIRVVAQLVDASDGTHLWSQRYDRELSDIFAVQDDIAEAIAAALRVKFGAEQAESKKRSTSLPAYEAFLRADYYWEKGAAGVPRSKELLEHALALDPQFGLAHYGLGRYYFLSYTSHLMPARDAVPLVRKHVEDALACDPTLAEAHALLGSLAAMYDYDWNEADRRFVLAFADGPVSADVHWHRANFYWAHAGRAHEAIEDMSRQREIDPLNPAVPWTLAVALRAAGRDTEADALYKEVMDIHVGYLSTIAAVVLSGNHLERGEIAEATRFAEAAYAQYPQLPFVSGQLAAACTRAGDQARAAALTAKLAPGDGFGAPFGLALAAIGAGDLDEAADWLERAIDQKDLWVSFLLNVGNIGGRVMWSSPRWPALAHRMHVSGLQLHPAQRGATR